jgi:tRNA A64-2'-O-ribosylphosphate transferase
MISALGDLPDPLRSSLPATDHTTERCQRLAYVMIMPPSAAVTMESTAPQNDVQRLALTLPEGKRGQDIFLRETLPCSLSFIKEKLIANQHVVVACESGEDASVGIVLAALELFFSEESQLVTDRARE